MPGLKMGVKNDVFWSETGSGLENWVAPVPSNYKAEKS